MIHEQVITVIDEIQGMLAKQLVKEVIAEGGAGSGHWAHKGRKGKKGGGASGGGTLIKGNILKTSFSTSKHLGMMIKKWPAETGEDKLRRRYALASVRWAKRWPDCKLLACIGKQGLVGLMGFRELEKESDVVVEGLAAGAFGVRGGATLLMATIAKFASGKNMGVRVVEPDVKAKGFYEKLGMSYVPKGRKKNRLPYFYWSLSKTRSFSKKFWSRRSESVEDYSAEPESGRFVMLRGVKGLIAETKSYGRRRTWYGAKGDLTGAARELATPQMVDRMRQKSYVGFTRLTDKTENTVMGLMKQFDDGKINLSQLEWGLKREFAVAYQDGYVLGQQAVGYTGDLMDEDIAFIKSFRRTENGYLRNFMRAIAAKKLVIDKYDRLKMYVDTIGAVFEHGRAEAAPPWVKMYWVPTRGAKHCEDCLKLAVNAPYTKETLPTTPRAGDTKCLSNCKCKLMIRYKRPGEEGPEMVEAPGVKPPGEDYELQPDLYDKFKGDVPEFRFFLDKNLGNEKAARKEFVATVKKAGVGFTPSNYDDPFNRRFFRSNRLWKDIEGIKGLEKTIDPTGPERKTFRKQRQDLMKQLLDRNKKLRKDGLRWIRPDGFGGYNVGDSGVPSFLLPKG